MVDVSKETKISLLLSVKRSQYQYIIWESTNEPIPTLQLLENHVGYVVGNPNRKVMHIFGFVGIFEYICKTTFNIIFSMCKKP